MSGLQQEKEREQARQAERRARLQQQKGKASSFDSQEWCRQWRVRVKIGRKFHTCMYSVQCTASVIGCKLIKIHDRMAAHFARCTIIMCLGFSKHSAVLPVI